MKEVLEEIAAERQRQDEQWGGEGHDDGHPISTWTELLQERLKKVFLGESARDVRRLRREAVILAALATAFVESLDRRAWSTENFRDEWSEQAE